MKRREFSGAQKAAIVLRATDENGVVACEGCGLKIGKKPYEINHKTPEALVVDKSKPLTIDDGEVLGRDCCHRPLTNEEHIPAIARAKRLEAKHLGLKKTSSRPMPFGRKSRLKKKISGEVVAR
jgi:hypothetical protein